LPLGDTSGLKKQPTWTDSAYMDPDPGVGCKNCHGLPPKVGASASQHAALVTPTTFSGIGITCGGCHPSVNKFATSYANIFADKSKHINGIVDGGSCTGCHGYPPAKTSFIPRHNNWSSAKSENYVGGGGAHTIAGHVPANADPSAGWANCTNCHNQSDHNLNAYPANSIFNLSTTVKIRVNPSVRFRNDRKPNYVSYGQNGAAAPGSGICTNVACHFQKTPKW
jgi:hypothetical protein